MCGVECSTLLSREGVIGALAILRLLVKAMRIELEPLTVERGSFCSKAMAANDDDLRCVHRALCTARVGAGSI
jgi:hypothetical protein